MILPSFIDLTPSGKLVRRAEIGQKGYLDNVEYHLVLHVNRDDITIEYYGDDDTYLDDYQIMEFIKNRNKI